MHMGAVTHMVSVIITSFTCMKCFQRVAQASLLGMLLPIAGMINERDTFTRSETVRNTIVSSDRNRKFRVGNSAAIIYVFYPE